MSERVGLNPKWFEPGKNFKTMFGEHVRKNRMRGISVEECISAAFRALLAGEAVPVDKDAKDAEVARLTAERDIANDDMSELRRVANLILSERDAARAEVEGLKSECSEQQRYVLDLESAIARKETRIKVLEVANDSLTQYSSNLTSERDTLQEKYSRLEINSGEWLQQRDALQAQLLQVESFVRENNAPPARISKLINQRQELAILNSKYIEAKHQRDALRARIDAGVPVTEMTGHSYELPRWFEGLVKTNDDQRTGILLIDARPIDQPDAAMVDERTGKADRREKNLFGVHGRPGKSDRRRVTPSTRADRGRHERELHLPVVDDGHERDDTQRSF